MKASVRTMYVMVPHIRANWHTRPSRSCVKSQAVG